MKKIFFMIVFSFVLYLSITKTYAESGKIIRVGLEYRLKDVSSIDLKNSYINVGFENNGQFYSHGSIKSNTGFTVKPVNGIYLKVLSNFRSYDEASNYAKTIYKGNNDVVPALTELGTWNVYIGNYQSINDAENSKNTFNMSLESVQLGLNAVAVYSGDDIIFISDTRNSRFQISDALNGFIDFGDRTFRDKIEFVKNNSTLTAVNVISVDEYLYSVVPSEMPNTWNTEALKAQSVVCRTYALSDARNHSSSEYDVCDKVHCQAYNGTSSETEQTTSAVNQTSGIIMYYNGKIINAVFHSSSGGHTEDSENVWTEKTEYLRGVPEINETDSKQWTRNYKLSEIDNLLSGKNINIGKTTRIYVGNLSNSGRVNSLIIEGNLGKHEIKGEEIRTFFSSLKGGSLESRNFTVANSGENYSINKQQNNVSNPLNTSVLTLQSADSRQTISLNRLPAINNMGQMSNISTPVYIQSKDSMEIYNHQINNFNTNTNSLSDSFTGNVESDSVVFIGKGFGHGVGMSQHGANGMAQMGYTYEQILKHYFSAVDIY